MKDLQLRIDFALGIPHARLELLNYSLEDQPSLGPRGWDRRQAPTGEEAAQDLDLLCVPRPLQDLGSGSGLPGHSFRQVPQRLPVEHKIAGHDPRLHQAPQLAAQPLLVDLESRRQRQGIDGSGSGRTQYRQSQRVEHQSEEVGGREHCERVPKGPV